MNRILAIVLLSALSLSAASLPSPTNPPPSVQLAWGAPACTNVITNYWIGFGVSATNCTTKIAAGTNLSLTVSNLTRGTLYFFAATAQDNNGLESDWSNEVSYRPPVPPTPPTLLPLVIMTAQSKSSAAGSQWVDTGASWCVSPDGLLQLYRVTVALQPGPEQEIATQAPKSLRVILPPMPPPLPRYSSTVDKDL